MKIKIWLYVFLIVPIIFLALVVGILLYDYTIEKSAQQNFVNHVSDLEYESIVSLEILTLHPLDNTQGKGEKRILNRDEIARVQKFLQSIETVDMTFFAYLGSRYYKKWFKGDTDEIDPFDNSDAPTYSCLLTMKTEANKRLNLLGSIYGQYKDYQQDLFLTNFNGRENVSMFSRPPKPVRVKNLGQWILEAISTSYANDKPSISTATATSTSTVAAAPTSTAISTATEESPSEGPIPRLQEVNLSENLIKDGDFNTLKEWERFHSSNVGDFISLEKGENYIVWERTNSQNDAGKVGVYQNLDVDVYEMRFLSLCLDVWVDYHTLTPTGWWWEERSVNEKMPVEIAVLYLDRTGKSHQWSHSFLSHHNAPLVLWVNPDTGKWEYKSGITASKNITPVPKASWGHFCFDLMDETIRKDPKAQRVLPKPARLTRILVYGNGWDFRGAVGNVMLRGEHIPAAETVPRYTLTKGRRRYSPGSSSFTFTTNLIPNVPKDHTLQFRQNHRVVISLSDDASIEVLDPARKPLIPVSSTARRFEVIIPRSAYYTIVFRGEEGSLRVTITSSPQ